MQMRLRANTRRRASKNRLDAPYTGALSSIDVDIEALKAKLAALKTEADAKTAWKRLAAKYPDILGPLAMHIEKVDLGTKGIYYRVQAGPFTDKNAARDVCAKLTPKGQPCLVKP